MSTRRMQLAIDQLPDDVRAAVMAYGGQPLTVALPYRCEHCGVLYRRGPAHYQNRFCKRECYSAAIAAELERIAARELP